MLEAELFSLLDRTADAAFTVTEDAEIVSWNQAAEYLFGYRAEDALHRNCDELLDCVGALGTRVCCDGDAVRICAARHVEVPDFDLQIRTRGGSRVWVNVSTLVYEDARRNRRLIVHLARDISQQKRNEELLAKFAELAHESTAAVDGERQAPVAPLSEQEKRILRLFAQAKNSSEIARELGITLPTLRNHLHSINEKLRTHNRLEAVMHAMRRGLI